MHSELTSSNLSSIYSSMGMHTLAYLMSTCNTSLSCRHTYAVHLADKANNSTHLVCHLHALRTISNDSADDSITHSIPTSRLGGVCMPPYFAKCATAMSRKRRCYGRNQPPYRHSRHRRRLRTQAPRFCQQVGLSTHAPILAKCTTTMNRRRRTRCKRPRLQEIATWLDHSSTGLNAVQVVTLHSNTRISYQPCTQS